MQEIDFRRAYRRSRSSLRRELEAREQVAVDSTLSTEVFSEQPSAKSKAVLTEDDRFKTVSRAAEAMAFSEIGLPPVRAVRPQKPSPNNTHGTMDDVSTDLGTATGSAAALGRMGYRHRS